MGHIIQHKMVVFAKEVGMSWDLGSGPVMSSRYSNGLIPIGILEGRNEYPLVHVYITMENHHV